MKNFLNYASRRLNALPSFFRRRFGTQVLDARALVQTINEPNISFSKHRQSDFLSDAEMGTIIRRSNKGKCISDPDFIFPSLALSSRFGPDEWEELIDTLQAIADACGQRTGNAGRAKVMISYCIDNRINTIVSIIGVLKHFGFRPVSVAMLLKQLSDEENGRPWWMYAGDGRYINLR
jgi:hypothetical protein